MLPMDLIHLAIIVGTLLAMLGAAAFMLHRSWGDFPTRVTPPPVEAPRRQLSADSRPAEPAASLFDRPAASNSAPAGEAPAEFATRILLKHPLLISIADRALAEKSEQAAYLVRDGDQIYMDLDRISDPNQRYALAKMVNVLQRGSYVSIMDTLRVMHRDRK